MGTNHNFREPMRNRKIATYLSYTIIGIAILFALIGAYWSAQSTDVLEIKNSPTPVRTIRQHPSANGVVILKVDYCKKTSSAGEVRTSFVGDSTEIFLPKYTDRQGPMCQITELPVLIPPQIAPGLWHVHFHIVYKVNPVRQSEVEFDSKSFEITPEQITK